MAYQISYKQNSDGSYDVILNLSAMNEEFGLDFWSKKNGEEDVVESIKKNTKKMKIAGVKVLIAGTLMASLSWASFLNTFAASGYYNMSYLYTGTEAQQITYVQNTKNSLHTVSPNYFNINKNGELETTGISSNFINKMHSSDVKVVPFISNHWDREGGIKFLKNTDKHSTAIAEFVSTYNLDGIHVDIENVTHNERAAYTKFVKELRAKIPKGKEVSIAVAANPKSWSEGWHGSYDYGELAKQSDYLMIMAYDEHYQGGEAGPVASLDFVEKSIAYGLKHTTGDKLVVGIPFFGRIWNDTGTFQGSGIDLTQVEELRKTYSGKVTYDSAKESPKLEFTVKAGDKTSAIAGKTLTPGKYTIWYENDQSIEKKLSLVKKHGLKGAGSWALGKEPGTVWDGYSKWLNGGASGGSGSTGNTGSTNSGNTSSGSSSSTSTAKKTTIKTGTVTAKTLNVRNGASIKKKKIATLKKGAKVTITGTPAKGWYKIKMANGKTGYVSSKYVKASTSKVPVSSKTKKATTNINVRAKASASSKKLGTIKKGTKVTIKGTSGKFSKISFKGKTAYVHSSYLK